MSGTAQTVCVGTAKGPGETPHQYTFVTPDTDETVKNGEFVFYETFVHDQPQQIIGRVEQRRPIRLYPDTFMADPRVAPARVAGMLGHDAGVHELFEVTVRILGFYDTALGDFVNPRLPPRSGRPIYLCSDSQLSQILSKRSMGQRGGAHIGSLLSRPPDAVPIVIDASAFTSTHLAIIAGTGAGKSYLAGVLIEELMKPHNRGCVLIIDPHGEYGTLQEMANRPEFCSDDGYRAQVRVFRPDQVKVRINTLEMGDYRCLLPNLSEKQDYVLRDTLRGLRNQRGRTWVSGDLLMELRRRGTKMTKEGEELDELDVTVEAILWRLQQLFGQSSVFNDSLQLPLSDLFAPGQCTVLQLNEIDEREQQVIVATILRRLMQARMNAERGRADENSPDFLPYPTFTLLEEAHRFAPANAEVVTSSTLRTILSEGRKFGVSVGLISQRPGKLDGDLLSQCMTQCILRIVNPIDQKRIAESIENVGRDLLDELPALSKGQVIIAGSAVNTPVLCRVRPRITKHGAESKDAPALWYEHTAGAGAARRKRDAALPDELTGRPRNPLLRDLDED
jgi:DNA helicase HerA-like ATPase